MSAICEELSCEEAQQSYETLKRQTFVKDSNGCIAQRVFVDGFTGGGSTTPIELTETEAKALFPNGLTTGALYYIQLDGTSDGDAGDVIAIYAASPQKFFHNVLFKTAADVYTFQTGEFNATGWHQSIGASADGGTMVFHSDVDMHSSYTTFRAIGGDIAMGNVDDGNVLRLNEAGMYYKAEGETREILQITPEGFTFLRAIIDSTLRTIMDIDSNLVRWGDTTAGFGVDMDVTSKIINLKPLAGEGGKIQVDGVDGVTGSFTAGANTITVTNGIITSIA